MRYLRIPHITMPISTMAATAIAVPYRLAWRPADRRRRPESPAPRTPLPHGATHGVPSKEPAVGHLRRASQCEDDGPKKARRADRGTPQSHPCRPGSRGLQHATNATPIEPPRDEATTVTVWHGISAPRNRDTLAETSRHTVDPGGVVAEDGPKTRRVDPGEHADFGCEAPLTPPRRNRPRRGPQDLPRPQRHRCLKHQRLTPRLTGEAHPSGRTPHRGRGPVGGRAGRMRCHRAAVVCVPPPWRPQRTTPAPQTGPTLPRRPSQPLSPPSSGQTVHLPATGAGHGWRVSPRTTVTAATSSNACRSCLLHVYSARSTVPLTFTRSCSIVESRSWSMRVSI